MVRVTVRDFSASCLTLGTSRDLTAPKSDFLGIISQLERMPFSFATTSRLSTGCLVHFCSFFFGADIFRSSLVPCNEKKVHWQDKERVEIVVNDDTCFWMVSPGIQYFNSSHVLICRGFKMARFIHLHRDWQLDSGPISSQMKIFCEHRLPMWLLVCLLHFLSLVKGFWQLYPEGTRIDPEKLAKCRKFAMANGLPVLSQVLTPRTKAWVACVEGLRTHCSLSFVGHVSCFYLGWGQRRSTI